jgi:hypothetical protein
MTSGPRSKVVQRLRRAALRREGADLSDGTLLSARLVLSAQTASACVPPPLLESTIEAASLLAAGKAATGLISARVAALTEGVVRAMLLTRFKIVGFGLVAVLLAGLGTGPLTYRLLAEKPKDEPAPAQANGREPVAPAAVAGKVTQVAADGKSITLTARDLRRVDVKLTDKTEVVYQNVGPGGAKPSEGYFAQVTLEEGSEDTAMHVLFTIPGGRR